MPKNHDVMQRLGVCLVIVGVIIIVTILFQIGIFGINWALVLSSAVIGCFFIWLGLKCFNTAKYKTITKAILRNKKL